MCRKSLGVAEGCLGQTDNSRLTSESQKRIIEKVEVRIGYI